MTKKFLTIFLGVLMALFFMSSKTQAITTIKSENNGSITLESNENINDNVATAGNDIYIRGTIEDDLFVAGSNIKIDGEIKGNLFAAANTIEINGKIDKDTFLAGNSINIGENATLGQDAFIAGNILNIKGNIERNLSIGGSYINLDSNIKGDTKVTGQTLVIGDNAILDGNLNYTSEKELSSTEQEKIKGNTSYTQPNEKTNQKNNYNIDFTSWFVSLLQFLLFGIIIVLLMPKWTDEIAEYIKKDTLKTIGIGILAFIVVPILMIIMLITIVGIPIAIVTGLLFTLFIMFARFWVAYCIGKWIGKNKYSPIVTILVGALILQIIFLIPILSILAKIVVIFAGLGAIYLSNPLKSAKK